MIPKAKLDKLRQGRPWKWRLLCLTCRMNRMQTFQRAWADPQGVLWAKYICEIGHDDVWNVTRQDWSLLTGECWCCFRVDAAREIVLDRDGNAYLITCTECRERSKRDDGLRHCPARSGARHAPAGAGNPPELDLRERPAPEA